MRSNAVLTCVRICCISSETVTIRSASATFDPSSAIWFPRLPFSSSWSTPIDRISAAMYDTSLSIADRRSSRRFRRVSCFRLFITRLRLNVPAAIVLIAREDYFPRADGITSLAAVPCQIGASGGGLLYSGRCCLGRSVAVIEQTHGVRLAITGGGTGGHVLP